MKISALRKIIAVTVGAIILCTLGLFGTLFAFHFFDADVISGEALSLYPREEADLNGYFDGLDDYGSLTWFSDDEGIASVDSNGVVKAISAGKVQISAKRDNSTVAVCSVFVTPYAQATLTPNGMSLKIGGVGEMKVNLPSGVTAESCTWSSSEEAVATVKPNGITGFVYAWNFGTTEITAVVTATDGTKYSASNTVLVTADYFYLTGINGNWSTYGNSEDAEQAGVLFSAGETTGVYTITCDIRANEGFEILHSDIDADWWTKLTPYNYIAEGSDESYVVNDGDMFAVNTYGSYTITIDLTEGVAKVYINLDKAYVTKINLFYENGVSVLSNSADIATIGIDIYPQDAMYDVSEIMITKAGDDTNSPYVAYALDEAALTIQILMLKAADKEMTLLFTVAIGDVSNTIEVAIAPRTAVLPTSLSFGQGMYPIDANNGGAPWNTTVTASVDDGSDIADVVYYSDGITVNSLTGEVTATGLGVFSVTATAVGNPELTATTDIVVYSSDFYLIGLLDGQILNDWEALPVDVTSLRGTPFDGWGLAPVGDSLTEYTGTFYLYAGDIFSIAFLGMADTWRDNINSRYFDLYSSTDFVRVNGSDIEVRETAQYRISLDTSSTEPTFTVEIVNAEERDLSLYLMRSGFSWDAAVSDENNILTMGGSVHVDGQSGNQTLTFSYNFSEMDPKRPIQIQLLTATAIHGGYFYGATWYGVDNDTVTFSGNAYSATERAGYFTNYGSGSELTFVGDGVPKDLNVSFTVTLNSDGEITNVSLTFLSAFVTSVKITGYTTSLEVGQRYTYTALVTYSNGSTSHDVTWVSSNSRVLEISESGYAVARSVGTVQLYATCDGISDAITVRVNSYTPPVQTTGVRFTSYTTVMEVDEEFEFAAQVISEDGTISNEVTWSSSNEEVIYIGNEEEAIGLAYALAEGSATITATAADGASASVDVLVSNSAIRVESVTISPESLELGVGWHARVYAGVLPPDAYEQGVHFSSSDTSIITVTDDGYVTAVAAGQANVIAMSDDGSKTAICYVTVIADLIEAQLSDANNTLTIGESKDLTVVLPEDVDITDATYQWTTSDDDVVSFYCCQKGHCNGACCGPHCGSYEGYGTLHAFEFGTVEVNVIVTLADGTKYGASGSVYVTASYFYLVGIRDDWTTYTTAEAAQEAGMLLVEDTDHPGIFSITRNFWAYDSFQIIHGDIGEYWLTKLTPYWYYAAGSGMEYVANTADMFEVNALGDYTIILDLTSGRARVSIDMVDLYVTEVDLSLTEGQNAYLQNEGDTTLLDIKTLPENAIEPAESDIVVTVSSNAEGYAIMPTHKTNVPCEHAFYRKNIVR